jgi:hypothetical protein
MVMAASLVDIRHHRADQFRNTLIAVKCHELKMFYSHIKYPQINHEENAMKIHHMLAVATFAVLAGCCQLSDEDRATLNDTKAMAQDAKNQAAQAAAAQTASQKADRIFRQSGVK